MRPQTISHTRHALASSVCSCSLAARSHPSHHLNAQHACTSDQHNNDGVVDAIPVFSSGLCTVLASGAAVGLASCARGRSRVGSNGGSPLPLPLWRIPALVWVQNHGRSEHRQTLPTSAGNPVGSLPFLDPQGQRTLRNYKRLKKPDRMRTQSREGEVWSCVGCRPLSLCVLSAGVCSSSHHPSPERKDPDSPRRCWAAGHRPLRGDGTPRAGPAARGEGEAKWSWKKPVQRRNSPSPWLQPRRPSKTTRRTRERLPQPDEESNEKKPQGHGLPLSEQQKTKHGGRRRGRGSRHTETRSGPPWRRMRTGGRCRRSANGSG